MQLLNLVFLGLSLAAVANDDCKILEKDCSFYERCSEKHFNCGPTGYNLNYGGKYCKAFKANADKFSPQGQTWFFGVMKCLQEQILSLVEQNSQMSCQEFKAFAYGTHLGCYTIPGNAVCSVPQDWITLLTIVRKELMDPASIRLALNIAARCGKQYYQQIINGLDDITLNMIDQ